MKIDMQDWKNTVISGGVQAMPMMSRPGLQITGLTMPEIVGNGENQAACVEAVTKRFPTAGAVTVMDLSVEAEAFGAKLYYAEDNVPSVDGHVVDDAASVGALQVPPVGAARTGAFVKSAELLAQRITDRPVFGTSIGPFSLAGDLMGVSTMMMAMMDDPATVHALCSKATDFLIAYARAFRDAGANGLIVADMSAALVSPKQAQAFAAGYFRKFVEAVQDDDFLLILHNCGKTGKHVPSMVASGAAGLHFGDAVEMSAIIPQVPQDRLVCGNISPTAAFMLGTADEMAARAGRLLDEMAPYPNFVLSSGCDVPASVPLANIDAFFAALQRHNDSAGIRSPATA
jgi:uroporphyrinogen decarboxylase